MMQRLKNILSKYQELVSYLFFGGLTTFVSLGSYAFFARFLNLNYMLSNALSWICAVLFAYITNRLWVFHSESVGVGAVLREIVLFFSCRLMSGIFDMATMFVCVDLLHINDMWAKFITQFIVMALNYIFSKLVIFRTPKM